MRCSIKPTSATGSIGVGSLFRRLAEEKDASYCRQWRYRAVSHSADARAFAAQGSSIPISDCEDITQSGNYVLTNDLVLTASEQNYGARGNCLVVSSSHVKIDLGGWTISIACPPFSYCPSEYGVVGGIGIDVMNGADDVSISNGSVENFVYGIVGEAGHLSASNLRLVAVLGMTLTDVSQSAFTDIAFGSADMRYHGSNGPIVYLEGRGKNIFTNLSVDAGSDLGGPVA